MQRKVKFFLIGLLITALFGACRNNSDGTKLKTQKIAMDKLKTILHSEQPIKRLQPFNRRPFKPYLDGKWIGNAVSYGAYRKGQEPGKKGPAKSDILEDLNIISKYWNLIRIYNADDDAQRILEVIRENKLPIKMMLGIWLTNETKHPEQKEENITNVLRGIDLANRFEDIIIAVNVGNESQVFWSWHRMERDSLLKYIRAVRNYVTQPVTTADDFNFWNKPDGKQLTDDIDFIVTHIYPLWNGKTLDQAIPWMDSTFKDLQARYPHMDIVLGETGWATTYNPDEKGPGQQGALIKGEVSLAAQERYLVEHNAWVNKNKITTFLFEAFDEPWKGGGEASGPNEVEKHWGVFHEDRTPKESFQKYLQQVQNKANY